MTKSISLQVKALLKKNLICSWRNKEFYTEVALPLIASVFIALRNQLQALSIFSPTFFSIAISSSARSLMLNLVEEKSGRFKETQKIMGLRQRSYLIGWLSYGYFKTVISTITLLASWAMFTQIIDSGEFGISVSYWKTVGVYWLYTIATLNQHLMFSTLFSSPKLASEVTTFLQVVTTLLTFLVFIEQFGQNRGFYILLSFFPNSCISLAYISISNQYSFFPRYVANYYTIDDAAVQLAVEGVVYFILYFYLDQVFPNEYGVSKHPLFFILDCFKKQEKTQVSDLERSLIQNDDADTSSAIYHEQLSKSTKPTVVIRNLVKKFGQFTAVDQLGLNLYPNEILCLLGHNGAGKTTTISMLTGLLDTTSGKVKILGLDLASQLDQIRELIGICNQRDVLYDRLTVYEQLRFMGELKGQTGQDLEIDLINILEKTLLSEERDKLTVELSGGNKRKLSLAMSLIGGSQIVFLDEPTSGMDAMSRKIILQILENLKGDGRTLVLTTHHLDEAEVLADRIAIMAAGKLLACGTSDFIKENFGEGYQLQLTLTDNSIKKQDVTSLVSSMVRSAQPDPQSNANTVLFLVPFKAMNQLGELFQKMERVYGDKISVNLKMNSLEDAFVNIGMDEEKFIKRAQVNKGRVSINKFEETPEEAIPEQEENRFIEQQKGIQPPDCLSKPPEYIFQQQFFAVFLRKYYTTIRTFSNYVAVFIPLLLIVVGQIIIDKIDISGLTTEQNDYIKLIFIGVFVILAFCFNSSIFISLPVLERETNLKYAINVMGCRQLPYWVGTFAFDYLVYFCIVIIFVIFSLVFQVNFLVNNLDKVFGALLAFGLALIPFSYFIGLVLFTKSSSAMKTFPLFNFFITYSMPWNIWGIMNLIQQKQNGNEAWDIPSGIWQGICTVISPFYTFNLAFSTLMDARKFGPPQPNGGRQPYQLSYNSWFYIGMLCVEFVFYSLLTLYFEYKKFDKPLQKKNEIVQENLKKSIRQDDGVMIEANRVNSPDNQDVIKVKYVQKMYENGFTAIKDVSFGIGEQEILGLLGPNGAGKSTMFNLLTSLIPKTSGYIEIFDRELNRNEPEIFKNVGICPQFDCIWENLTPVEHLYLFGRMKGLSGIELDQCVQYFIQTMQLEEYTKRKAGRLSGGNKRKLCVSDALIGGPCVQFFDEPSTGVDPIARRFLWKTLKLSVQLRKCSDVITTHTMDEAESLCDRIAILVNGQFYCIGSPQELRNKYGEGYNISMKGVQNQQKLLDIFQQKFNKSRVLEEDREGIYTLHIPTIQFKFYRVYELLESLKREGLIQNFSISQSSLESVFLYFSRRQEELDAEAKITIS